MNFRVILTCIVITFALLSCGENAVNPPDSSSSLSKGRFEIVPPGLVELTDEEIAGLIHARQEEKVARDVYTRLYEEWGEEFIANIMLSEQKHMDAVKRMLTKYEIEDPVVDDGIGQFTDPYFTDMFNDLVASGTASEEGAIEAGIIIENSSITFLEHELSYVTAKNLVRVYTNLLRGSNRHLLAFLRHQ